MGKKHAPRLGRSTPSPNRKDRELLGSVMLAPLVRWFNHLFPTAAPDDPESIKIGEASWWQFFP